MDATTDMIRDNDLSYTQMIFQVQHSPVVDVDQSPCELAAKWHIDDIRVVTLMDGDVGFTELIDCAVADYTFPNASLYFNDTAEYQMNMDLIQKATGLLAEVISIYLNIYCDYFTSILALL